MDELLRNPALRLFAVCYLLLVLKMMALGTYTSVLRIRDRVYATPEDYDLQGMERSSAENDNIERVRRAHRNDLENILPFFGVGLFYALTQPSMLAAQIGFIGFTLIRFLYSIFYIRSTQPHRTIVFVIGTVLMLWMLIASLYTITVG
jgi:uncharacterized MAPEG superfamily protein